MRGQEDGTSKIQSTHRKSYTCNTETLITECSTCACVYILSSLFGDNNQGLFEFKNEFKNIFTLINLMKAREGNRITWVLRHVD